jgi:hypothetical protein
MLRRCSVLFLALVLWTVPAWADELKTLTGKNVTGTLEKITDGEIVLKTAAGTSAATPLSQVLDVSLRPGRNPPFTDKFIEVQLFDDSILRCTRVTLGAKELQMELTSGATVKAPMSAFVSMLRDAHDADLKKQWLKLIKTKSRGDRIYLLNEGNINSISGILSDIDEKEGTIKFKRDGAADYVAIKLDRLQGMSFLRTDAPTDPSLCKVIDIDGNALVAVKLQSDGNQMIVTTHAGTKVALDAKVVARLDFNFGRLTYLSDLDAKVSESPLFGGFSIVRKDRNLDGGPIMLQDKTYPKGLSMYAGADMTYNLEGKYKEFKAQLGADAQIADEGQGKVIVSIYCDGEKRFTSDVTTKAARPVAINVKDVSTLRIVVSGTNFTNYAGHATLANAHVSQ